MVAAQTLSVGDRIAYSNGEGHEPRWFFGAILSERNGEYRVKWDDGYDDPTVYTAGSLVPEAETT